MDYSKIIAKKAKQINFSQVNNSLSSAINYLNKLWNSGKLSDKDFESLDEIYPHFNYLFDHLSELLEYQKRNFRAPRNFKFMELIYFLEEFTSKLDTIKSEVTKKFPSINFSKEDDLFDDSDWQLRSALLYFSEQLGKTLTSEKLDDLMNKIEKEILND